MAAAGPVMEPDAFVNRQQLRDHLASDEFRNVLLSHAQGLTLVTQGEMRSCFAELMQQAQAEFSQQGAAIVATTAKVTEIADNIVQHSADFDAKHLDAKTEMATLGATQALLVSQLNDQFAALKSQQEELDATMRKTQDDTASSYGKLEGHLKSYTEERE